MELSVLRTDLDIGTTTEYGVRSIKRNIIAAKPSTRATIAAVAVRVIYDRRQLPDFRLSWLALTPASRDIQASVTCGCKELPVSTTYATTEYFLYYGMWHGTASTEYN